MLSNNKLNIINEYDSHINWNVTGFGNDIIMYTLLSYLKYLKNDLNINNLPIKTLHGSYMSKYNGGRNALFTRPLYYIYDKIKEINNLGIGIKLTFSPIQFDESWFNDKELNEYFEILNETKGIGNGIICSSDNLADYIHNKYQNLEVTSSYVKMASETKMGITDTPDYYNKLFNKYDIVVFNTFRAFDDEFLSKIKHLEKIEFIVNNSCNVNCPIACKHYETMYKYGQRAKYLYDNNIKKTDPQLEIIQKELNKINENCIERRKRNNIDNLKYQYINTQEINHLLSLGINNFKIEGRDYNFHYFRFYLFKYIFNNDSILDKFSLIPGDKLIYDWYKHKLINDN